MGDVICISEVIDISPDNLDSSLCFFQLAFLMMYFAYKLNKQVRKQQLELDMEQQAGSK